VFSREPEPKGSVPLRLSLLYINIITSLFAQERYRCSYIKDEFYCEGLAYVILDAQKLHHALSIIHPQAGESGQLVESSPCLQAKNQGCEILFSRKKE
jgi:hypothetical protein